MEPLTESDKIARALARAAYDKGEVRLTGAAFAGCTHLVATRQGLFAVSTTHHVRIAFGSFYGLTLRGGAIFAFEACDLAGLDTHRGRIVRLECEADRIVSARVLAAGLDNGCHQIDFIDGRLTVLDTQRQRVLRFSENERDWAPVYPLPPMVERAWSQGYVHINSLLQAGGQILLLLHNGVAHTGRPSEVAIFDLDWRETARWPLPGGGCHNLVLLEDGSLIACGSMAGAIIGLDGPVARVSDAMTRGLSVGAESVVVGAGKFTARRDRQAAPGTVHFLDRAYAPVASLEVPGAPTEIRRLDACDLGLSTFRQTLPGVLNGPGE